LCEPLWSQWCLARCLKEREYGWSTRRLVGEVHPLYNQTSRVGQELKYNRKTKLWGVDVLEYFMVKVCLSKSCIYSYFLYKPDHSNCVFIPWKMVGLYIDTFKIGHKLCSIRRIHTEWINNAKLIACTIVMSKNVFWTTITKTTTPNSNPSKSRESDRGPLTSQSNAWSLDRRENCTLFKSSYLTLQLNGLNINEICRPNLFDKVDFMQYIYMHE